jgi:type IV secretory pathway VirB4 component
LGKGLDIDVQAILTGRGCIIGQSGSGKSFLMGVIAEELCRLNMAFCVIDTEGEYSSLKSMFNVIIVGGDNKDIELDTPM